MIEVYEGALPVNELFERIDSEGCGSVAVHLGVVKPMVDGKGTRGILFERAGDLLSELRRIEDHVRENWDIHDVLIARRLGRLEVGDAILIAAVSAETKKEAMAACDAAVDELKKKVGLKKTELFE